MSFSQARFPRPVGLFSAMLFLACLAFAAPISAANDGRLIVLGFDGADGRTAEEMMANGELPNLKQLSETGTFARLGTTIPNESPTSWASLNSGRNPGETGVTGFVMRLNESPSSGSTIPPMAYFGYVNTSEEDIGTFDNLPVPDMSPPAMAGILGGGVFIVFLIFFAGLLRMRLPIAGLLSLLLGSVGGVLGFQVSDYLPSKIKRWNNLSQVRNFWDYAGDAGVQSVVLGAAMGFDMEPPAGVEMLAGLGVPDARGGLGDWFIYTDDPLQNDRPPKGSSTGTAGTSFRVDYRDDVVTTQLYGPVNFWEVDHLDQELAQIEERLSDPNLGYPESIELRDLEKDLETRRSEASKARIPLDLIVTKRDGAAAIRIGEQEQVLKVGEWSDYYHLNFKLNPVISVKAITRVKLVSLEKPFKLFVNTIDQDPEAPNFWQPISFPFDYAGDLARGTSAPFETYGWACATMPFKDGEVEPETLLEDIEFTMSWRERLTYNQLERNDWRLFMGVFSVVDRVQHMMYQYYDREHPLHDAEKAAHVVTFFGKEMPLTEVIPEIYRQLDRIVGKVLNEYAGPDDTLLVCADHGFQSFRRQVHLNNWLYENGYITLKSGDLSKSDGSRLQFVDWSQTKAYAMGLGFIYVNEEGREYRGIVKPEDKPALLEEIRDKLLGAHDEEYGASAVDEVYLTSVVQSGDHMKHTPDIVLGFKPPYRASWSTSGGGMKMMEGENDAWVPGPVFTDNTSAWSGGHPSMSERHVRGIFASNRRIELPADGPNIMHIAPTSLAILGVDVPEEMDLKPLKMK